MQNKLGFVVDSLNVDQITYTLISEANKIVSAKSDLDISCFFIEQSYSCLKPFFARYNYSDMISYDGPLVATSLKTANLLNKAYTNKKFYYIYNLDWLWKHNKNLSMQPLYDDSIVKFTRCKDYIKEIQKVSHATHVKVVEDFNIDKILEIICG